MPGARSRQGCEECRGRRRKCDERKPVCGQCSTYDRSCNYTLKVVWDAGRKPRKSGLGQQRLQLAGIQPIPAKDDEPEQTRHLEEVSSVVMLNDTREHLEMADSMKLPRSLPNGIPLSPRYHRLLTYFTHDILASLSCHPSVHEDLCRGLIPVTLHSPQLLSACLALSAAGFLSRGLSNVDGVEISRILGHLQTSGLSLLRTALEAGQMSETLLATCVIWCLADVFTYRQGSSSWRIHLQGIKAILDSDTAQRYLVTQSGTTQSAMRHLYLLYLSLQTLPHVPATAEIEPSQNLARSRATYEQIQNDELVSVHQIDGFLGYSEELLHVLQQINHLSRPEGEMTEGALAEADILLGKVNAMISRDAQAPPDVSIVPSLSPEYGREFSLCHMCFQQATLVHLYRRLYHLPSNAESIQVAVERISEMVSNMTQGQPCHTWVAMAMPLFTIGCEAFTEDQRSFVLDKVHQLEICIGSFHVRTIRQALEDMWKIRTDAGDLQGDMCASSLLGKSTQTLVRAEMFLDADTRLHQTKYSTISSCFD